MLLSLTAKRLANASRAHGVGLHKPHASRGCPMREVTRRQVAMIVEPLEFVQENRPESAGWGQGRFARLLRPFHCVT